jgi:hypothetical protein
MVHADIEVEHDEDRRLQPVGEVEGEGAELERFGRILGEQQHVFGVAMGSVGAGDDVALLGAGRHSGRGSCPLHVEQNRRDFREISKTQELRHQRNAGSGSGSERPRAVPGGADDNADRGKLVLALHDGDPAFLAVGINAQATAMAGERVGKRG